jgi:methyl-accepting chemotaxis protein
MIRFFFPEKDRGSLSLTLQKRIPILVYANLLLFAYFLAATFTRYRGDPEGTLDFLVAVIATNMLFIVSLALVRARRYGPAAWISTLGMFFMVMWIGTLLPIGSANDIYRFSVYLVGSGVANSLVAINRRQVIAYSAVSVVAFILCLVFVYVPALPGEMDHIKMISSTMLLFAIAIDLCLYLIERLSLNLISVAEEGLAANGRKASALSAVLERAAENLRVGDQLVSAADGAKADGKAIRAAIDSLRDDSVGLASDAKAIDAVFAEIIARSEAMRGGVTGQSASLAATGEAIERMLSTMDGLSSIAKSKKSALDDAVKSLSEQLGKAKTIADGIASIGRASNDVLGVAGGIMDISEKTNLLAMNASIEAAHAGSAGKGFAVLAQEIRKLSEESRVNTTAIGDALSRNEEVVESAAKTIDRFVADLQTLNRTVAGAFDAMGEIIDGLGDVSAGARQVAAATSDVVAASDAVSSDVVAVSGQIGNSGGRVAQITRFASVVETKAARTAEAFSTIESALERVAQIGKANVDNVTALDNELKAVRKS